MAEKCINVLFVLLYGCHFKRQSIRGHWMCFCNVCGWQIIVICFTVCQSIAAVDLCVCVCVGGGGSAFWQSYTIHKHESHFMENCVCSLVNTADAYCNITSRQSELLTQCLQIFLCSLNRKVHTLHYIILSPSLPKMLAFSVMHPK